jgi:hypothetical protein
VVTSCLEVMQKRAYLRHHYWAKFVNKFIANGTFHKIKTRHFTYCTLNNVKWSFWWHIMDGIIGICTRVVTGLNWRNWNRSEKFLTEVEIGQNVLIPLPNVVRGKGDPRNVMAVHNFNAIDIGLYWKHA